ncbi:MAG: hypothetical protein R2813_08645 [Flavobacteriales bacterium]
MRNPIQLFAPIGIFLLISCDNSEPIKKELEETKAKLQEASLEIAYRDSVLTDVSNAVFMIDSNLDSMKSIEMGIIGQLEKGRKGDKEQIRGGVEAIQNMMAMNQAYIDQLRSNLSESNALNQRLMAIIESLEEKVRDNNIRIAQLNGELAAMGGQYRLMVSDYTEADRERRQLRKEVSAANKSIGKMNAQMEEMENNMNTVYAVSGTKKELVKVGVLEQGGLRKKQMNEDVDRMAFTPYDMRVLTELKLNSSKVKLVTEHPSESYRIVQEEGKAVIKIEGPKEFWSLTKYLIVIEN